MRIASCGFISNAPKVTDPSRSIPELVTNTPSEGRFGTQSGFKVWCVGPTFSNTRKWTQPQERKKAKTGGGVGERRVELVEELKGRNLKLPNRRASSRALERLSEVKRATSECLVTMLEWKDWTKRNAATWRSVSPSDIKRKDTASSYWRSVRVFVQRRDACRYVLRGKKTGSLGRSDIWNLQNRN